MTTTTPRHLPAAGDTIELVCLHNGYDVLRARRAADGELIIVRCPRPRVHPVPGEIFTLPVEHSWVFGHTVYVRGDVTATTLDVGRLRLAPLGLEEHGPWEPEDHAWLFEDETDGPYGEIRAAGPRPMYEMEQVWPQIKSELRWEEDPILEAVELAAAGALPEAEGLLGELTSADLRCLDAHAHLGNFDLRSELDGSLDQAARHYGAGVAIGELSLPVPVLDFEGLLPWGLIDNRPFLRCLHGLGLCRWRQGDLATAGRIFRRLVWLAPMDGLGARFLLGAVEAGRTWEEIEQEGAAE